MIPKIVDETTDTTKISFITFLSLNLSVLSNNSFTTEKEIIGKANEIVTMKEDYL